MSRRLWPVVRALSATPRVGLSPFYRRPWYDLSRIDQQMAAMQRDMDKVFGSWIRMDPWFNSSFAVDANWSDSTVTEVDGKKHINFHFDVHSFKPEQIEISTKEGKTLEVSAKSEDTSNGNTTKREYHRVIAIPETVKPEEFKSVLSPDGVLSISAPLNEPVEEAKSSEQRTEDLTMDIKHQ